MIVIVGLICHLRLVVVLAEHCLRRLICCNVVVELEQLQRPLARHVELVTFGLAVAVVAAAAVVSKTLGFPKVGQRSAVVDERKCVKNAF